MLYGVVPFEDYNIPGLLNKIKDWNLVFHNFNKISPSTEYLIKRLLDVNVNKRMDWEELFEYFSMSDKMTTSTGSKTPSATLSTSYKSANMSTIPTTGSSNPMSQTPTSNRFGSNTPVL